MVGPAGSGKSVLLRLIAGLSPPSDGRVIVRGTVAPALPALERLLSSREGVRKAVLAVAMMTRLPRLEVKRRLPEIFELAGLRDSDVRLGTKLTPQQRQRVVLSMMLLVDADIVLVDVPLSTGRTRERFLERIRERTGAGATVVAAARTADELVEFADEIVYLTAGRLTTGEGDDSDSDGQDEDLVEADDASGAPPAATEVAESEPPGRELPMSPDAERYLDFIRVLVGDRRTRKALRLATDAAPEDAARVEWNEIARCAGFDWGQQLGVVKRLRQAHGAADTEPILGSEPMVSERPLSSDAKLYVEHLRILVGDDRADEARRNAQTLAPDDADRIEWTWVARWAGYDWVEQLGVIERLRRLHGIDDAEPIYGTQHLRQKLAAKQSRSSG